MNPSRSVSVGALNVVHTMAIRREKYTEEILRDAVAHATSVARGVLENLGLNQAGGTHAHISRMIKKFEIDTSHFVRYQNGSAHKRLRGRTDPF